VCAECVQVMVEVGNLLSRLYRRASDRREVRYGRAGNLERRIEVELDESAGEVTRRLRIKPCAFIFFLDQHSKTRVKQHLIDPDGGDEVSNEEIKKGFEVEPGTFVILDQKELKSPTAMRKVTLPWRRLGFECRSVDAPFGQSAAGRNHAGKRTLALCAPIRTGPSPANQGTGSSFLK
jgi:hypothetical protein